MGVVTPPYAGVYRYCAHQDGLQLGGCTLGLTHEHLLGDVLPPLHAVQTVVCVTHQHGPAQELGESLHQTTGGRLE